MQWIFRSIYIVILFLFCMVWMLRFLKEAGLFCAKGKVFSYLTAPIPVEKKGKGNSAWKKADAKKIFAYSFLFRLLMFGIGVFLYFVVLREQTNPDVFSMGNALSIWEKWDATHYINLAKEGYAQYTENGEHLFLVFFPLYPWLLRLLHFFIRNWHLAGILLSMLAFSIGCVFFFETVKQEYGKKTAMQAWILICLYPFGFFFGGIMSESLFFCLLAIGFFCIKSKKWLLAGIAGMLCALCRVQGVLLFGAALVEIFVVYQPFRLLKERKVREIGNILLQKVSCLFLISCGSLIYLFINYKVAGNPFQFQYYQREHWFHRVTFLSDCLEEIVYYIKGNTDKELLFSIWIPELVIFIITVLVMIYAFRSMALKDSAFLLMYTLLNYSVTFLISGARYMACAIPLFIGLALWTGKRKWRFAVIALCFVVLQGIYFSGYLLGKQIL